MNATITSDYRPVLDDPIEAASDPRPLALFTSNLHTGGAERVTVNLLRVAAAAGIPLDLLLARAEGPLLAEVPPQVRVINFGVARVRGAIPQLVRYLRRERPRGVISHMTHVNLTAIAARALARTGTPVICVEHSQFSTSSAARAAHPWELTFASWLYPWADHIVGVSRGVARNVEQSLGLPQGRVQSIYNPIVDSHLLAKAEQPCPHPWFAASDRPVLLSVGHLGRPEKDHTMLLHAFALVREARPARLVIFGEGAQRGEIEALRRRLGLEADVDLPGATSNPYAAMRRASLFVLSSRSEGLPTVLVEALACGCPIVSTACPSGPAEILDGGRFGILVPPENPQALAVGILRALDQTWDREELVHRGAQFSAAASLRQYLAILNASPATTAAAA